MKKQKLIELLRKAYLSGIMENELAGRMVGVNHNLEDMATHYAEIEVNNGVLDDVSISFVLEKFQEEIEGAEIDEIKSRLKDLINEY